MTKTFAERFLVGCSAGVTSSIVLQPLDVLKTKLQSTVFYNHRGYNSYRSLISNLKLRDYWRGLTPTIARASLGPGLYFSLLEFLEYEKTSGVANFLKGSLARTIAATIINPITVLKVRYEFSAKPNPGLINGIQNIVRQEGINGLTSGLTITLLRDVPQSGIYLAIFTTLKHHSDSTIFCGLSAGILATAFTAPFDIIKTLVQLNNHKQARETYKYMFKNNWKQLFRGLTPRLVRKPLQMAISWIIYDKFR